MSRSLGEEGVSAAMVNDQKKADDEGQEPKVDEIEAVSEASEAPAPTEAETSPEEARIEALEIEIERLKELHNNAVRAAAEYDNAAKRAQRELQDARKYGVTGLVRDLLGIVDNLQRAVAAVPEDALQENEQLKTLVTGVEMIERELQGIFEKHHIEVVDPKGDPFDPHLHEAMFEMPAPDQPEGSVVQVVQVGYRLHDRLLRPARVGIGKGGPKKADGPEPSDAPGSHVDTEA